MNSSPSETSDAAVVIDAPNMTCYVGVVHGASGSAYAAYTPSPSLSQPIASSVVTGASVSIHGPRQFSSVGGRNTSISNECRISVVARAEDAGVVLLPGLSNIPRGFVGTFPDDAVDAVELGLTLDVPVMGLQNTQTMSNMERAVASAVHQTLLSMVLLERCGQVLYDVVVSFSVHSSDPFHRVLDVAVTAASLAAADARLETRDLVSGTTLWVVNADPSRPPSPAGATAANLSPSLQIVLPGTVHVALVQPYATVHIATGTEGIDIAYLFLEGGLPIGEYKEDPNSSSPNASSGAKNNLLDKVMACGVLVNKSRRQVMINALREAHADPPAKGH